MTTTVRLPDDLEQRVDQLAAQTHRSKSFYLREAIKRGLPQVEWEYGILQRAEAVRSGQVKTRTLDQVAHDLGLDS